MPGVFFPHFTHSTKILLQFLETPDLQSKSFLELGCGTGIISVLAAKKGASVTASDINPTAIKNARLNARKNKVKIDVVLSDLFKNIPPQVFDYIIINPPYYPKTPANLQEAAWFCGTEFNYFEQLFSSLSFYFSTHSKAYMILSEDCETERIKAIAQKNKITLTVEAERKKWGELNTIFQLKSQENLYETI